MTPIDTSTKNTDLWQSYEQAKSESKMLFPTEGSQKLGVSELELLLASPDSQYLGSNCVDVLNALTKLPTDKLESIVRNDFAVHEKLGKFQNLKAGKKMGIMLNVGGLDLRYFMSKWKHILAVTNTKNNKRAIHSIQFFDGQGNAINKVYLKNMDDLPHWQSMLDEIITSMGNNAEAKTIELDAPEELKDWQLKTLNDENKKTLHEKWLGMTDVHQFFGILADLEIDRASSYIQAPDGMATKLNPHACEQLLNLVQQKACPIMIFVGNTGVVQIQTGTVKTVNRMGDWLNILDKDHNDFTLHLKDSGISQLWWVKRPIVDGYVTCIEAFDDKGRTIATIFGQRQEGNPELDLWVEITDQIAKDYAA